MAQPRQPKRHVFSKRVRVILRIGGTALVLAVVMLAVAWFAVPRGARVTPEAAAKALAQSEYQQGVAALSSGETTQAAALLTKAAADGSVPATVKLAEVAKAAAATSTASSTSSSSNASTASTAKPSTAATPGIYASRIADLPSVVPTAFSGFHAGAVTTDTDEYSVPLEPTRSGPYAGSVRLALITITDYGKATSAASFVSGMTKAFPKNGVTVTVGRFKGRFGTDGTTTAAVRFARGRYVVEVVITSTGVAPSKLKTTAVKLAGLMPAAR